MMNKTMKRISIGLIFLLLTFVIYRSNPPARILTASTSGDRLNHLLAKPTTSASPAPLPIPDPACIAQGGRWEPLGLLGGYGCNLPTTDGGKSCTSSIMCEGDCLADHLIELYREHSSGLLLPDINLIKEVNARGEEMKGACSFWRSNFSCHIFVEQGQYSVMCID